MPKKTLLKLNTYSRYIDINTKYCYLSDKYAFAYLSDSEYFDSTDYCRTAKIADCAWLACATIAIAD